MSRRPHPEGSVLGQPNGRIVRIRTGCPLVFFVKVGIIGASLDTKASPTRLKRTVSDRAESWNDSEGTVQALFNRLRVVMEFDFRPQHDTGFFFECSADCGRLFLLLPKNDRTICRWFRLQAVPVI